MAWTVWESVASVLVVTLLVTKLMEHVQAAVMSGICQMVACVKLILVRFILL